MNTLAIFYGDKRKLEELKKLLYKKTRAVSYTEYDFHNVSHEDRLRLGGEGKIVIHTLARFVDKTVAEIKSGAIEGAVAFIDGFIARVEETVDVTEYISPLLEVCDIFYFAYNKSDAERLEKLGATTFEIG